MQGMEEDKRLLSSKNTEYIEFLRQRASFEGTYNIAYAEKILQLKSDGYPVSILAALARGDRKVASIKRELDIADGIARACQESMKDIRASIDSARSYLSWLKAEMQSS